MVARTLQILGVVFLITSFAFAEDGDASAKAQKYTELGKEIGLQLKELGIGFKGIELVKVDPEGKLKGRTYRQAHYRISFERIRPLTVSYIIELNGEPIANEKFVSGLFKKINAHSNTFLIIPEGAPGLFKTLTEVSEALEAKEAELKKFDKAKAGAFLSYLDEYHSRRLKVLLSHIRDAHIDGKPLFSPTDNSFDKSGSLLPSDLAAQEAAVVEANVRLEKMQYEVGAKVTNLADSALYHEILLLRAQLQEVQDFLTERGRHAEKLAFKTSGTEKEILAYHKQVAMALKNLCLLLIDMTAADYKHEQLIDFRRRLLQTEKIVAKLHLYGIEVPQSIRSYGHAVATYVLEQSMVKNEGTFVQRDWVELGQTATKHSQFILTSIGALEIELKVMKEKMKSTGVESSTELREQIKKIEADVRILRLQYSESLAFNERVKFRAKGK